MPHVDHGIGTWYAGKRNIVTRKGSCTLCGAYGDLRSYDTTLYIVFLMIPLIPLKRVHVIDDCPACRRHRTIKQKEWDLIKGEGIQRALEEIQTKPGDRETALKAIGAAVGLQDNEAFLGLSALLEETSGEDPIALAALAEGYAYFNHNAPAEAALRKATSLNPPPPDDVIIREQLGVHLLMHGDPDEGVSFISHILDQRDAKKPQTLLLAVEAYRAAGRHADALAFMDRLERAFPAMASDKRLNSLRRSSTKLAESNKPIKVAYIHPKDAKVRTERAWQASIPRLIGPIVALLALAAYLGAAWWIGENRLIHIVSGVGRGYNAEIGGRGIGIPRSGHTTMRIPEGVVIVRVTSPGSRVPETSCRIQTNFFARPFTSPVIVVNPDRLALVQWEEGEYLPPNSPKVPRHNHALHIGELVHTYDDIDYVFEPFPPTVEVSSGSSPQVRHRVDILPAPDPMERIRIVAEQSGSGAIHEFAIRGVQADPDAGAYAEMLASSEDRAGSLATLKPLLADRPVRISAHRAYQEIVRTASPDGLLAEYRELLAKAPDDNALKYLLGRLEDQDREKAARLWRESMNDPAAGGYAVGALVYDLLSEARFDEALAMIAGAPAGGVNELRLGHLRSIALHGLGRFDELLKNPDLAQPVEDMGLGEMQDFMYFTQRSVTLAKGRDEGRKAARAILDEICAPFLADPSRAETVKTFRAVYEADIAYADGDDSVEASLAGDKTGGFMSNLCKGDLAAAAKYAAEARGFGDASAPLLLAIAATLKADESMARDQFEAAAKRFDNAAYGRRICAGWLRGTSSPAPGEAAALSMDAREKSITLVALGLKIPERREECFTLARKLNFDRRAPYLLLARAMETNSKP